MSWAKLCDRLHANPKVRKAGVDAMGIWVIGLSFCAFDLTDGFIDNEFIGLWAGSRAEELAARLVAAGLWTKVEGGFQYNDYLDYNPSAKEVLAQRDKYKARQSKRRPSSKKTSQVESDHDSHEDSDNSPAECLTETPRETLTRSPRETPRAPVPDPDPVDSHTHTAGARASESTQVRRPHVPPPEKLGEPVASVFAALRSHPELDRVATPRLADRLSQGIINGKVGLEWVTTAISEAAASAGAMADIGTPLSAEALAGKVLSYVRNAKAPREPSAPNAAPPSGQGRFQPVDQSLSPHHPSRRPYKPIVVENDDPTVPIPFPGLTPRPAAVKPKEPVS